MSVKQRLKDYLKFKHITERAFAESIEVSSGYVSAISKSIQPDKMQRISMQYPDLNTSWLLTGEGNMLNEPEVLEQQSLDHDELVVFGGEYFAAKMLELFRKGLIYSYDSYKLQSEEYREILIEKDKEINALNQEIGKLNAIIEIMKGTKPEDMLK